MSAQALLPLPELELPDLGEVVVRPRLANAKCWEGYDPETTEMPGRNHPQLARALLDRFIVGRADQLFDPYCGSGLFLVEAFKRGAEVAGCDISVRAALLAVRNLDRAGHRNPGSVVRSWDAFSGLDDNFGLPWTFRPTLILTSPVYPKQNKNSGDSELQTHLKTKRGLKAQLEFWDSDTPGHLARVPDRDFWYRLGAVWRGCLRLACPGAHLLVVTKDRVKHGQRVPFTRMVAESIAAAGWQVEGLLWRRLDPSNTQRMQVWHFARKGRVYPLVDREEVIVARRLQQARTGAQL